MCRGRDVGVSGLLRHRYVTMCRGRDVGVPGLLRHRYVTMCRGRDVRWMGSVIVSGSLWFP
jgi:hypothetical protein